MTTYQEAMREAEAVAETTTTTACRQRWRRNWRLFSVAQASTVGTCFFSVSAFPVVVAAAFQVNSVNNKDRGRFCSSVLDVGHGQDDVITSLERARALLVKSKKKLEAKENGVYGSHGVSSASNLVVAVDLMEDTVSSLPERSLPFFANQEMPSAIIGDKRLYVVKSVNEATGLITTDGEKMAKISEEEEWEARSLREVFDNEIEDKDAYSVASKQLASRDVAASIWNLRKTMQLEDYKKIFDENDRFIGEGN